MRDEFYDLDDLDLIANFGKADPSCAGSGFDETATQTPLDILIEREEALDQDPDRYRSASLRLVLEFLSAGVLQPTDIQARLWALLCNLDPVRAFKFNSAWHEPWHHAPPDNPIALFLRAQRDASDAAGIAPVPLADVIHPEHRHVTEKLLATIVLGSQARAAVVRAVCLVHIFCPHAWGTASMDHLGQWLGVTKANISAAVKSTFNKPIEKNGGVAHAWFQKSAGAVESYRAAALGNTNRKDGFTRKQKREKRAAAGYAEPAAAW